MTFEREAKALKKGHTVHAHQHSKNMQTIGGASGTIGWNDTPPGRVAVAVGCGNGGWMRQAVPNRS